MAFGARELRLVLSIQSYGTGNLQRLRRDILALNATTKSMNAGQLIVQQHIVQQTEKLTKTRDRINKMEQAGLAKQDVMFSRAIKNRMRFDERRQAIARKASGLELAATAKQLQISKSLDRITAMRGSGMEKFAVREAALSTRKLGIQKAMATLPARELTIQSRILNNKATQLLRERQLVTIAGKLNAEQIMAGKNLGNYTPRIKEAAYRWRAAAVSGQALQITQKNLSRDMAIYESQLRGVVAQEQLIAAGKTEQAAATARQVELTAFQHAQLIRIEADQAEIVSQIASIDTQEAAVNMELQAQLEALKLENVQLERMKVLLGEIGAELKIAGGQMLKNATVQDAAAAKQASLLRRETRVRTVAHVARTAQFGGLIGTAVFATAAASFASFNKQVTLAATQARNVNRPLSDIPVLATAIQNGVHKAGIEIEGIIDLMKQFPATGDEMAKASYDIFSSMDISFGGGMKLLKTFNQLAVATGSDLATATDAGITVMNNFGKASGTTAEKLNLMATTIRFGRMRLEDLNAMLEKIAPAATVSGQRLQDVAGAMVAITRLQPSQRVGATGIARLLQTFRDPDFQKGVFKVSDGLADITKGKGAVGALKPLPEIIKVMARNFGLMTEQGGPGKLFKDLTAAGHGSGQGRQSRIEAINAYGLLVGHVEEYLALQGKATTDTKEFAKALKAMSESPGVRWDVMINQFRALILVIGEAAIPALLTFVGWIAKLANWFSGLDSSMRKLAITFGVAISVFALFGGTILSLVTAVYAARINMLLMQGAMMATGTEAEAASLKVGLLGSSLKILTGIGIIAIPIVMQAIRGGDPSGWDILMAAGFGAAGGYQIGGPYGAAIGAITVPIILDIQSKGKPIAFGGVHMPKGLPKQVAQQYENYINSFSKGEKLAQGALGSFLSGVREKVTGKEQIKGFQDWIKLHPRLLAIIEKQAKKHGTTQEDVISKYIKTLKGFGNEQLNNIKANQKQIDSLLNDGNSKLSDAQKRELALRKAHVNAVQQATKKQQDVVKQAVDNLSQIYDQLHQQNEQAFGGLGQGSVMTGVFGSVFTGLNDLLRQFGVQIPIPFAIIKKDMDQQFTYFKRFRGDLDKLQKAGAPPLLIEQIQAMGPDQGIAFAEGILAGGKKGFKGYFKEFNNIQKMIDTATKTDLHRKLKYWEQYGKDAAFAMVTGLSSSLQSAGLRKQFASMIHKTFGAQLKKQLKKDTAAAYRDAVKDYDTGHPKAAPGGPGSPGKPGGPGGHAPHMTLNQARRAARVARREYRTRVDAFEAMTLAARNSMSPGGAKITAKERIPLDQLWRQRQYWSRRMAQTQGTVARLQETANFRGQLSSQRKEHPNAKTVHVTYHGDTYNVKSTVSAKQLEKLIHRQAWRKRHKVPRS